MSRPNSVGGNLYALFQAKGDVTITENYRDVVITDVVAKVGGSDVR